MTQPAQSQNGFAQPSPHPQALRMPAAPAPPRPGRARAPAVRAPSDAPCMTQDIWIYRIVVTSFAAVLILAALGALTLAFTGKDLWGRKIRAGRVARLSGMLSGPCSASFRW